MVRRLPVRGAFHLRRTLGGLRLWGAAPWVRVDASGGWLAARTGEGPATLRLWMEGSALCARAWGPGASVLLARAPRMAGLHDDPEAVPLEHPLLARLAKRRRGVRLPAVDEVFPTLVAAILAQKVTGKASAASTRQMAWFWGERPPGPRDDLRLLPAPSVLRDTPYALFHRIGVERRRAMVVIEAARRARRLEACVGMPFPEASARLQVLPGIGPWTAGVVLGQALGDPDAVPIGDYHLPDVVAWNLAGEPRANDARMLELLEPFRGQRGRVVRLLKGSGSLPPKWGPRSEVRDIRGM